MKASERMLAVGMAIALPLDAGVAAAQTAERPTWLAVDTASRTAILAFEVTAPSGSASARINGFREGGVQVVVPLGWTVRWNWVSHDSAARHSLVVGQEREKLPERAQDPGFPNAMTRNALTGLAAGQRDATTFAADQTGWFWLYCGVPDHALRGEWISLRVTGQAKEPQIVVKAKEGP
jgi:hypothetical protein